MLPNVGSVQSALALSGGQLYSYSHWPQLYCVGLLWRLDWRPFHLTVTHTPNSARPAPLPAACRCLQSWRRSTLVTQPSRCRALRWVRSGPERVTTHPRTHGSLPPRRPVLAGDVGAHLHVSWGAAVGCLVAGGRERGFPAMPSVSWGFPRLGAVARAGLNDGGLGESAHVLRLSSCIFTWQERAWREMSVRDGRP